MNTPKLFDRCVFLYHINEIYFLFSAPPKVIAHMLLIWVIRLGARIVFAFVKSCQNFYVYASVLAFVVDIWVIYDYLKCDV